MDHVDDVDAAIREMIRVVAPRGLILLVVEIHPKPTIAEPHTLPWGIAHRFEPMMQIVEERHLELPTGGMLSKPRNPSITRTAQNEAAYL